MCVCVRARAFVHTFVYFREHILAKFKNVKMTFCSFLYFPPNGAIGKVVIRDIDLLFQDQIFKLLICLKRMRSSTKKVWYGFCRFWKWYSMNLTYVLRSIISNANISEIVRVSTEMDDRAFINFDIWHSKAQLEQLYSMALTYLSDHFKC